MNIRIAEHKKVSIAFADDVPLHAANDAAPAKLLLRTASRDAFFALQSQLFKEGVHRYTVTRNEDGIEIGADYCIGIGHLGTTGYYVQVEPKLNKQSAVRFLKSLDEELTEEQATDEQAEWVELDYLKMYLDVIAVPEAANHIGGLLQIDWNEKEITIKSKDDQLTPLLVVQYLNILKRIVRKGLRKSYYRITENLNNRIKGKILVGQQIKQNVLHNRLTQTICNYETFGTDSAENRFLKKVLQYCISYIENNKAVFHTSYYALQQLIAYCRPPFELIGDEVEERSLKHFKPNPFFNEYKDGIRVGQLILKRFAYNFTQTAQQQIATPPFWIDMPRLFELYVYSKMVVQNPTLKSHIHFQFSTNGNALDILVSDPEFQMVIDAKYKLHYKNGHLHNDIRQVAGYSRLTKVRKELCVEDDRNIDCLIIYPDVNKKDDSFTLKEIKKDREKIKVYHKVYKLGVKLPCVG